MYQCSKRVNVPLIGTKGCINYNPVLAQRQFGYPIAGAPISVVLEPLLVLYEEGSSVEILLELRRAWNKMVIQGKDNRPWTMNRGISYERWLMERVWMVKLPFKLCVPEVPKEELEQEQESEESKEVKQLKQEVDELKGENVRLTSKLFDLRHIYDSLVKDQEKIMKKQKREERQNTKLKQDLIALHARLEGLIQQRDQALATERQWIQWYEEMEKERKLMFDQIHNFHIRIDEMEHLIREGEDKARKEHVQRLEEEVNYLTQIVQLEECLEEHEHITKH